MSGSPSPPIESWWNWAFNPSHAADVAGWGFWLGALGLLLTVVGFAVTLRQLAKTKSAAEAAKSEVDRIQSSMKQYDSAHEVSRASYALGVARKHFKNEAWDDGADSYSDVRNSLISLKANIDDLDIDTIRSIDKSTLYVDKICERVDRGDFVNTGRDDVAKIISVMRQHDQLITSIKIHIQKGVF